MQYVPNSAIESFFSSSLLPKISEYDQKIAQSHTWHRGEEPQNISSNKTSGMVEHYHKKYHENRSEGSGDMELTQNSLVNPLILTCELDLESR